MRRCVNALALHTVKLKKFIKKNSLESSREMDARRRRGGRGELRQRRSKRLRRKGGGMETFTVSISGGKQEGEKWMFENRRHWLVRALSRG